MFARLRLYALAALLIAAFVPIDVEAQCAV